MADLRESECGVQTESNLAEQVVKRFPEKGEMQVLRTFQHSAAEKEAMNILWVEWESGSLPNGHGVEFHDKHRGNTEEECRIAFVEGFAWLKDKSKQVTIGCIKPDALTPLEILDTFKRTIEDCIKSSVAVPLGYLGESGRLWAEPNC